MDEAERLLQSVRERHSCLMFVPLGRDIREAADEVRDFGHDHGMELSIVPMVTETDQKLAIGLGTPIEASNL